MQVLELGKTEMPKGDSNENVVRREVLKLSDMNAEAVSDLASMFGKWFEADHCDKGLR